MNITMIDYMKKESLKILVVGRLMNCNIDVFCIKFW